ncbi:MAG TPA: hypothetical protein VFE47_21920 [Tepidisphaeraceae bacterium]|jgi:hypothetical protein|nr:hypothetical protein [Tepidisphaeraceae bacterium]
MATETHWRRWLAAMVCWVACALILRHLRPDIASLGELFLIVVLAVAVVFIPMAAILWLGMICTGWLSRWVCELRPRYRQKRGLCRQCGYDIRQCRERCSECGSLIEYERNAVIGERAG